MMVLKRTWGWIYAPNVYVDQVPPDPQTPMTSQQEYLEEFDYEIPRTPHTEGFLQTILVSTQNNNKMFRHVTFVVDFITYNMSDIRNVVPPEFQSSADDYTY